MPLLSNIERRALETGIEKGAKENCQQNIIKILVNKFDEIPKTLIEYINKFDDITILYELFIPSLNVNSLAEFEQLINTKNIPYNN